MPDDDRDLGNAKRDLFAEATGHPLRGMFITMILGGIFSYLDGARMQMTRISANHDMYRRSDEGWEAAVSQAHLDIHFYFICWNAIFQRLIVLKQISKMTTPRKILKRYRGELARYSAARDHLEHFPDRIYGKKNKTGTPLAMPGLLGSLDSTGMYYFGGESYDVSSKSLAILEQLVTDLNVEMTEEARAVVRGREE